MANVRLIAQRAGVSITTVSRVLNNHPQVSEEVRRRVLTVSNKAGYQPQVGRKSTTSIAFVYTGEPSLGSPFDAALMYGMSTGMEEHDYDLMVLDARRARQVGETYSQMFMRKGIRGAVLRTTAQTRGVCEAICQEGFPAVVLGDRFDDPRVNFIYSESRPSSREAVEHLVGLGHRQIALCVNIIDDSDHADRLAGYRESLAEHGIELDERLILRVPANREGGVQALRRMQTMASRPTAIFLTDPATAFGAVSEARNLGMRIPEDLSVVGFDDTDVRFTVYPELTAVCQDAAAMGREAFAALNSMLDKEAGVKSVRKSLRTWLEIHGSTGTARQD